MIKLKTWFRKHGINGVHQPFLTFHFGPTGESLNLSKRSRTLNVFCLLWEVWLLAVLMSICQISKQLIWFISRNVLKHNIDTLLFTYFPYPWKNISRWEIECNDMPNLLNSGNLSQLKYLFILSISIDKKMDHICLVSLIWNPLIQLSWIFILHVSTFKVLKYLAM